MPSFSSQDSTGKADIEELDISPRLHDRDLEKNLPLYIAHEPDHLTQFPNRWSRCRYLMREFTAEFMGVMVLIIFGTGVDLQVVLSSSTNVQSFQRGDYLSINFGWAIGTAIGIWVSAGFSGGHINPAVTLSLAVFRNFPWKKVPLYIVAQVLGGFTGALLTYANYTHALDAFEGVGVRTVPGTASLFSTYASAYETNVAAFFDEFLGTAVLLIAVLALTDSRNGPPPAGLLPLAVFVLILGIGVALGMNTGYAINPARDLGPRLATAIFYGRAVWTYRNQYWLWCPVLAPILGALTGSAIYDAFFFTGPDSIFNTPSREARQNSLRLERARIDNEKSH